MRWHVGFNKFTEGEGVQGRIQSTGHFSTGSVAPVATKATGVKKVTVDTGYTWATGD